MNTCILMGNLTRDVEVRQAGTHSIASFGLALNRKYKTADGQTKEEVTFVDCEAWGKTGEAIAQYFPKGRPILIEGRLKLDTWEDKNGGGKRSKLKVVVESFHFAGGESGKGEAKPPARSAAPSGPVTVGDEDIPFSPF